jgi:hypothetical protein
MDIIPQSNQLNPALTPQAGFYFGIPGISSLEVNAGNSALSFNDVMPFRKEIDSLSYFLYNQETQANFFNKLRKSNFIYADNRADLISLGLRIRKTYVSFYLGERAEVYGFVPYDLYKFGVYLNQKNIQSETFDLSSFGTRAQVYLESAIGLTQELSPTLSFGIKAKFLNGLADLRTTNSELTLKTGLNEWETSSSIEINSSIPLLRYELDSLGYADMGSFEIDSIDNYSVRQYRDSLLGRNNKGFAIDLGILVKPTKKLTISASLLDLGYIRWKNNINNFTTGGTYKFNGAAVITDSTEAFDIILDSLENMHKFTPSHNAYSTMLSAKLYAGIHYQIVKGIGVGALTRQQIVNNTLYSQYTFSLNLNLGRVINTTYSYTILNNTYDNFGFALSLKSGPFQIYTMLDRIPLYYNKTVDGVFIPAYAKEFNFRFGMNLLFGCRKDHRVKRDKPLVDI